MTPPQSNESDAHSARPDVSVVIPTCNRSRMLALAIASVLDQRDVDLEVIVIDEASTDDTAAMVRRLKDHRVRLIRHERRLGKSAARNRGVAEARGEWIAFLDDDDVWAPDKLQLQVEALDESGRSWAYAGAVNITHDHRILGGAPPQNPDQVAEALVRVNGVPGGCSSVIVRKRALPPQPFDDAYRLCEDWDLWIRLAVSGLPAAVPKPLVGYRVHSGNSSIDTERLLTELDIIERRYGGPVDRVVFYRHLARVCLRVNRQWQALGHYVEAFRTSRRYALSEFVPDASEVFGAMAGRVMSRVGAASFAPRPRQSPAQSAWCDEARLWIDNFVRRHAS
jgi:glycosyltransferase involved in cell wall biosynthesis